MVSVLVSPLCLDMMLLNIAGVTAVVVVLELVVALIRDDQLLRGNNDLVLGGHGGSVVGSSGGGLPGTLGVVVVRARAGVGEEGIPVGALADRAEFMAARRMPEKVKQAKSQINF